MEKLKNKKSNGITLIALIITIIVMLILVGVTITVALNGGLFTTAKSAATNTIIEAEKEQLLSAVVATMGDDGKVNFTKLDNNLPTSEWTGTNGTYTSPKGNKYTVSADGTIEYGNGGQTPDNPEAKIEAKVAWVKANYQDALNEAAEKGQTTTGTSAITDIAIGTDGNIVNLNLWNYLLMGDEDGIALAEYASEANFSGYDGYAYKGTVTTEGKIEGTIPQIICMQDGKSLEVKTISKLKSEIEITTAPEIPSSVTKCVAMFAGCKSLTTAPKIPSSVTSCAAMFSGCTSLTTAPKIPSSVTECWRMFEGCSSLATAPEIPSSVTGCEYMFSNCTSLTTAPVIPSSVTDCSGMFSNCTSLRGDIIINANLNNSSPNYYYELMLRSVGSEQNRITLKGSCPILEEIKNTGNADYITIEQ